MKNKKDDSLSPKSLKKLENGISQINNDNERHDLGDFTKYIDEDDE